MNSVSFLTCKSTIIYYYDDDISSDIDQINLFSLGKCNAVKLMVIAIHLVDSISHSLYSKVQN